MKYVIHYVSEVQPLIGPQQWWSLHTQKWNHPTVIIIYSTWIVGRTPNEAKGHLHITPSWKNDQNTFVWSNDTCMSFWKSMHLCLSYWGWLRSLNCCQQRAYSRYTECNADWLYRIVISVQRNTMWYSCDMGKWCVGPVSLPSKVSLLVAVYLRWKALSMKG